MQAVVEVTQALGAMSSGSLIFVVVLASLAVAGFAIHAVLTIAKDRR